MKFETRLFRTFFSYTFLAILLTSVILLVFLYNNYLNIEKKNLFLINILLQDRIANLLKDFDRIIGEINKSRDLQYFFDEDRITSFFAKKGLLTTFRNIVKTNPYIFEIRIQKRENILLSSSYNPLDIDLDKEIYKDEKTLYRILKWNIPYENAKLIIIVNVGKVLFDFDAILLKEDVSYILGDTALFFDKNGAIHFYPILYKKGSNIVTINNSKYLLPNLKTQYLVKVALSMMDIYKNLKTAVVLMLLFISIIGLIFYFITKRTSLFFAEPIRKLSDMLLSVQKGEFKKCTCGFRSIYEVTVLIDSFNLMVDSIREFTQNLENMVEERTAIIEKQKEALEILNEKLEKLSITDNLTGVYNRRYLDDRLSYDFEIAKRNKLFITLAIIDIDKFKSINDTYGHLFGDIVIKEVAEAIKHSFRRKTDKIFRYGGDEFIVYTVYSEYRKGEFLSILEDLRKHIAERDFLYEEKGKRENVNISISIGVSFIKVDRSQDIRDILSKADEMLYKSKESGRDQMMVWDNL